MRNRFAAFLGVLVLLGLYTGMRTAQLFPEHWLAATAAPVVLVAFFVAWQIGYRNGTFPEESRATRALAWTASVGMGVWATYLLLTVLAHPFPAAAAASSLLIAGLGLGQALSGPRVKEVVVDSDRLAPGLRGLRIAQISDLHVGPTIRRGDVERVVERVLALEPDLIAITGDMADGTVEALARHVEPLARLRAPLGVYYVPGNHEYYWNAGDWLEKAAELGFIPLINENRVVARGGAKLLVGGIPDESGGHFLAGHDPDQGRAAATEEFVDFRLLLAHRPDGVPQAARAGFDLQLSGHTHGGQFFPASLFIGLFHRFTRGLYRHDDMAVYVNPGTGYWGPAHRFGVPSEITLLRLRGA
jgi:predicted MPP superfamily phosphohydrolase